MLFARKFPEAAGGRRVLRVTATEDDEVETLFDLLED